jgi:hypothetical protein
MKIVYFGESLCRFETLQRLFLVADEIAFLDRPSVGFGNWGTVGEPSPASFRYGISAGAESGSNLCIEVHSPRLRRRIPAT